MEPIASGDEIAGHLARLAVLAETDRGLRRIEFVHADVANLEENLPACVQPGADQIFDHLVLSIDRDRATAGELMEVDVMVTPAEAQVEAVMNEAFALQPLADTRLDQQVNRALFEHPRADALFDMLLAAGLEHDGLDV